MKGDDAEAAGAVRYGAVLGSRHFICVLGSGCGDGMNRSRRLPG
jgi:hypothetical protein